MFQKWFPSNCSSWKKRKRGSLRGLFLGLGGLLGVLIGGGLGGGGAGQFCVPSAHAGLNLRQSQAVPQVLREIEAHYRKKKTLQAQFKQENFKAAFAERQVSFGKLSAQLPAQFRWETQRPDPNLLVSDGKTVWFYTPPFSAGEKGQVVKRPASQVASGLAHALLSGSFGSTLWAQFKTLGPRDYELIPRHGSLDSIEKAVLTVDPVRKQILRVRLFYFGGNTSDTQLSEIRLGDGLAAQLFRFEAPPQTEELSD